MTKIQIPLAYQTNFYIFYSVYLRSIFAQILRRLNYNRLMKIYTFSEPNLLSQINTTTVDIQNTLHRISDGTDTSELVVSTYLIETNSWAGGTAYAKTWLTPDFFSTRRGKWKITSFFEVPTDLPGKFKLIRLLPIGKFRSYPRIQKDGYGWEFRYETFIDHLATLFAHELHHYRRFHLGFHPGEGEKSANRWALGHAQLLGFKVKGYFADKEKQQKRRRKQQKQRARRLRKDPYKNFRILDNGAKVLIKFDPQGSYLNEVAIVERPIRTNSKRMIIRTSDGKIWRWPMIWLQHLGETP